MAQEIGEELRKLKKASAALAARVKDAVDAARYRQGREALPRLLAELQKARSCMQLAQRALDGDLDEAGATQSSWLRSKMSVLTGRIIGCEEDDRRESVLTQSFTDEVESDFQGSTEVFSIPDLLGFLQVQSKTGVLRVELEDERVFIEVENGDLVHAYSENSPPGSRLGEILVAQGAIDEERLESFLYCYAPSRGMLGHALNQGELVTEDELRKGLDHQVQQLFLRLFKKHDARFAFKEGALGKSDGRTRLNVTQLLLESARQYDEGLDERQPVAPLPAANEADDDPLEALDGEHLESDEENVTKA